MIHVQKKYHARSLIQDFLTSNRKMGISQVYNKTNYHVMMALHFLNDVANDAGLTHKSKITP